MAVILLLSSRHEPRREQWGGGDGGYPSHLDMVLRQCRKSTPLVIVLLVRETVDSYIHEQEQCEK
jgi:hypothetical protein